MRCPTPLPAFSVRFLLASLAATFIGCGGGDAPFPAGFYYGVATAGFQNDPGCPTVPDAECIDSHSDWYDFVTSKEIKNDPSTFVTGEPLQHAPGSYELFAEDFDLVKDQLGGNAVRLSLEWSRIFPTSTVGVEGYEALKNLADPKALAHYHAVFAALSQRHLLPLVTLHHYTLPSWIHDAVGCHKDVLHCKANGWLGKDVVPEIAKYAGFAAKEFGGQVDLWATLNEPFAVVIPGYIFPTADRTNPPSVSLVQDPTPDGQGHNRFLGITAALSMIDAHARMYDAIKHNDTVDAGTGTAARVGLVYNLTPATPRDPENPKDVQGARDLFYIYNEFFLNATIRGDLDANLNGQITHRDDLAGRMDYLGINYYTRAIVDGTSGPFLPQLSQRTRFNPLTLTLWTEYPQGLYDVVMFARSYGVPALITENGSSDQDHAAAPHYLVQHLTQLQRAITDGARVEGYFYWTLVDNYEWNHGMSMRFGLYQLEPDSKKTRTPREAVDIYRQVIAAGGLSADLLSRYPLPQ